MTFRYTFGRRSEAQLAIFDIDGTISNSQHRQHMIDWSADHVIDWEAYSRACIDDAPIKGVIALMAAVAATHHVVLLSGRNEVAIGETLQWSDRHGCVFDEVILRKEGDHRKNADYKRAVIQEILDAGDRIAFVVDDHGGVKKMLEELGVPCVLVASNEQPTITPENTK